MTTFVLKIIAVISMLIDHFAYIVNLYLFRNGNEIIANKVAWNMHALGRVAFIVYVFLIAEGCRHTKNIEKYLFRLFMFAFVSEIPYDLFSLNRSLYNTSGVSPFTTMAFNSQNVFVTLFLGGCAIYIYKKINEINKSQIIINYILSFLVAFTIGYIGKILKVDYGFTGVMVIYLVYVFMDFVKKDEFKKLAGLIPLLWFTIYTYKLPIALFKAGSNLLLKPNVIGIGGLLGVACVLFYNGKKGKNMKWLFYAIYPIHLLVFGIIMILMR